MASIRQATVRVDIDGALRVLNEDGSPEEASRLCSAGGPVVYCNEDGSVQVVDADSHSITFASTGKGKTRRFVYPTVFADILAGTNIVVNDMKGEIYETTKDLLERAGYEVFILDLREPHKSPHRYNPLAVAWDEWHAGNEDAAFMYLRNFAHCVFDHMNEHTVDIFWANSAINYFVGLTLGMLEMGVSREAFTLESVAAMDINGDGEQGRSTSLARAFEFLPKGSLALQNISGTLYAPERTRSSILSTFRVPMSLYSGLRGLMDVLCRSDFSAADFAEARRALFVISPDETHSLGPVVVGILNQLMSGLITLAQRSHGGRLPHRVDFILDEMGNLPARIPDMEALVSAARSRNMRFHFVLQSAEQLTNVYGEQLKDVILDNCDTWVFMGSRGLSFLRYVSELAGTVRLSSGEERPLLTIDKLQHLESRSTETEALVFLSSLRPYVAALKDIGQYEAPAPTALARHVHREVVHEVYDVVYFALHGELRPAEGQEEFTGGVEEEELVDKDALQRELEKKFDELFGSHHSS